VGNTLRILGRRSVDGAEPGADADLHGDGAEAESVVAAVTDVAEEQVVLAVTGTAGLAEEGRVVGVLQRAGDGGRHVDGGRAAHHLVH